MTDYLLELSKNRVARDTIKSLGLPIPIPPVLDRLRGPAPEQPLAGKRIAAHAVAGSLLGNGVVTTISGLGAEAIAQIPNDGQANGLVLDATGLDSPSGLRALYDFFHPLLRQLVRCSRAVVIGRTTVGLSVSAAAAQGALEGFVRSLGKELGKNGSTSMLLRVEPGAEARLTGALRFSLTPASAFIDLQVIEITSRVAGILTPGTFAKPLTGKVAVVTGAARGIGAATAKILADEGAKVVVVDRPADEAAAKATADAIGGVALGLDVGAPNAGDKLSAVLKEQFGGVDIVVHNAGITRDKTLARMSPEQWDQVIAVNLESILRINEALLKGTLRDGGRIVCLSSVAGIAGNMGQTNYGASKAGVIGLVRALATEVAPRGITVNAVAPGFIETRMTAVVPFAIREGARRLSALGQGGLPEDVGQAIAFLASPGALGITGNVLRVCGGALIGA